MVTSSKFWKDKKVFITGHTGFKGSWLTLLLTSLGAKVYGFALPPNTNPNLYTIFEINSIAQSKFSDVRDFNQLKNSILEFSPDIVFHLAAQPLVLDSYENPMNTYTTNINGTLNLFEIFRQISKPITIINITTDKCYSNKEWIWGYREEDQLGGNDPYSSSKACSELITSAYIKSFFCNKKLNIGLASARAGNVIGGGDWSKDRLIPDIIRAISENKKFEVRNLNATRPWQHVLEPLSGYLLLAKKLHKDPYKYSGSWNFGPLDDSSVNVDFVVKKFLNNWSNKSNLGIKLKSSSFKESIFLKLDSSKSRLLLNWKTKWTVEECIQKTSDWYKNFLAGNDMVIFSLKQISEYTEEENIF